MSTLMKIGFGTHAIVMTEGVVTAMDPSITLFPHSIERPFVHDWSVVEERGQKLIEMELHWPSTPRGAA